MLDSLARTRKRWLSLGRTRPHVVLVLVESVGALNLLPGGRWDRELTPNMFAFAAEGALFPAVYSPFPATIRSHVSIMTGGYVLTWGSVYKDLGREFLGPTIPSTFRGKGYRTAFFSSGYMDSENSDGYYRGLGFEELFFPEELPPDDKKRLEISSWGIEEGHVADRALEWLLADSGSPALLVWNLNTPHHPYLIPGTAEPYEKGADDRSKHRSAMHHVDAVLGDFARRLKDAGLDNTVVALVGDHGEAFGIEHAGNFLHRSSLYEENVRSFAVLTHLGGALAGSPAVGDFPVGNGALLPTLAEMADGRPRAGSLFAPRARILYFFKNAGTQQVGLRDGGWKFVADQMKGGAVRLYKLDADPEFVPAYPSLPPEEDKVARADACETEDVSARYPELAAEYLDLCRRWLAAAQNAWASRLRGNTAEDVVRAEDLLEPGPKRIAVGHMEGGAGSDEEDEDEEDEDEDDEDDDGETFVPSLDATISVSAKPAIWTKNVAWIEDTNVVYAFRGPEGEERNVSFVHSSEWMDTYLYPAASLDGMREGRWEVVLWQGERRLLGMNFTVVA
ncbi:alkaline-phosphatase-like protein [Hyaloraphidium curvatum]|nr:alkaline-phosphatase-like protein [Hyaloraphidium curvatum]